MFRRAGGAIVGVVAGIDSVAGPGASLGDGLDEVVLTAHGYAELVRELGRLSFKRPVMAAQLSAAVAEAGGGFGDDPEVRGARAELELLDERMDVLRRRLRAARVLSGDESSSGLVSLGSHVILDDLDDGTTAEYLLVSTAESDPLLGHLSNDSPVGRAIEGHKRGDTVEVHVPHGVRHLRIAGVAVDLEKGR